MSFLFKGHELISKVAASNDFGNAYGSEFATGRGLTCPDPSSGILVTPLVCRITTISVIW